MTIEELALVSVAVLALACDPSTLQGIDGVQRGAPNGLDPHDDDLMGPVLVHVHEDGIDAYAELHENVSPVGAAIFAPSEPVRGVGAQGNDLLVVSDTGVPNEVRLWRYPGFAAGDGEPAVSGAPMSLDAIGEDETLLDVRGEAGLWIGVQDMVTTETSSTAGLTFWWSPSGAIDGSWTSHRVHGFVYDWALLGDGEFALTAGFSHLALLEVRREEGTFGSSFEVFPVDHFEALEYHRGDLFALGDCYGPPNCEEAATGILVWRDIDADPHMIEGPPDAFVVLPEIPPVTHECSLAVNDAAVVVGTCRTDETSPTRLFVYRDPSGLQTGAQPDEVVPLEDSALELAAIAWSPGDVQGRRLSVFTRARRSPVVHMYDDRSGALAREGSLASAKVPQGNSVDILVLD